MDRGRPTGTVTFPYGAGLDAGTASSPSDLAVALDRAAELVAQLGPGG